MSKILIITRRLNMGGIEIASINLANAMADAGHDVHLWSLRGKATLKPKQNVTLHDNEDVDFAAHKSLIDKAYKFFTKTFLRHFLPGSGFIWLGNKISPYVKNKIKDIENKHGDFDLILVRGQGAFELIWKIEDPRLWQMIESTENKKIKNNQLNKWLLSALLKNKQIITVSNGVAQRLHANLEALGIKAKQIKVIHNSLPIKEIRLKSKCITKEIPNEPYIINVARLVKNKDQCLLIKALKLANLPCKLVIVGDGPEKNKLESLARKLNISDRVLLVGNKDNPYPWIAQAKFFVLSSTVEGFGLVLAEAFACGIPVVSTDAYGGIRDVLIDEQVQYISQLNAEDLARKMRNMWDNPVLVNASWAERFDMHNALTEFNKIIEKRSV
ncbi:MAG: glycosyltransferase [Aeromonas sp.]